MKREINPQESNRAEAFRMWMSSPMPMVTLVKTLDVSRPPRSDGWWSCCTLLGHIAEGNAPFVLN